MRQLAATVHVQQHWVQLDELFNKHIAPLGLTRSTHATDGDGRYFAAMKVNMTGDPTWASGEATSHWVEPHQQATPTDTLRTWRYEPPGTTQVPTCPLYTSSPYLVSLSHLERCVSVCVCDERCVCLRL